ncbi:MAG: sulfite exporter TauE/SafE family protein [Bacteroidota bacterium]
MWTLFISALSLGFLGSFHCVGMCGPIALALPVHSKSNAFKIAGISVYNFGRIITYTLLGAIFGLFGESFSFFGFQQQLSITIGVVLLLSILLPLIFKNSFSISNPINVFISKIKSLMGKLFKSQKISSLYLIGLLNGLLPCGFVYLAIAGAMASGSILNGALFMLFFGLGNTPAMFSVAWISQLISLNMRNTIKKAVPVFVVFMAVLFILRGLNLGIPYVSPKFDTAKSATEKPTAIPCHK